MKKTAMKAACMCMAALMACAALTSCGTPAPEISDTVLTQQAPSGKIAIHFEGTVTAIDGDRITLDNGKIIVVTADTAYTDANGTVENAALSVGDYIQGSTADDPASAVVTAKRIHIAF